MSSCVLFVTSDWRMGRAADTCGRKRRRKKRVLIKRNRRRRRAPAAALFVEDSGGPAFPSSPKPNTQRCFLFFQVLPTTSENLVSGNAFFQPVVAGQCSPASSFCTNIECDWTFGCWSFPSSSSCFFFFFFLRRDSEDRRQGTVVKTSSRRRSLTVC